MDEGDGDQVADAIGERSGAISGAQWVDGPLRGALLFDGADDYVSVGDVGLAGSDFTLAAPGERIARPLPGTCPQPCVP